jgi:hypothetical protein
MKKLFLLLTIAALFSSCTKEMLQKSCEKNNEATLSITNSTGDKYKIYINQSFKQEIGAGTVKITVPAGAVDVGAEQATGYTFYPTRKGTSIQIEACGHGSWSF